MRGCDGEEKGLPSGSAGRAQSTASFRESGGDYLNRFIGHGETWKKERKPEKERVEPTV